MLQYCIIFIYYNKKCVLLYYYFKIFDLYMCIYKSFHSIIYFWKFFILFKNDSKTNSKVLFLF